MQALLAHKARMHTRKMIRRTPRLHDVGSSIRSMSGCGAPECGTDVCASGAAGAPSLSGGSGTALHPAAAARTATFSSMAASAASRHNIPAAPSIRVSPPTLSAVAATTHDPPAAPSIRLPPPTLSAAAAPEPVSPSSLSTLSFLHSLFASRKAGYSLSAPFYLDPAVYAADLQLLWGRGWIFAGYESQLPKAGDYFTYEVGEESLIVIRGDDASPGLNGINGSTSNPSPAPPIRSFHNSCRHRGSRIVPPTQETKHVKRLVCPYHQWSYARTGELVHARDMGDAFDKSANGLAEVHCETVAGLVFLSLTPKEQQPLWPFEPARRLIEPQLKPHGLRESKIAHSENYTINANWKLVYENNRECYHCAVGHPEYVQSNYDLHLSYKPKGDGTFERDLDPLFPGKDRILAHMESRSREWESMGLKCSPDSSFPGDGWYRASRMPLKDGWVTESLDGRTVCKVPMGQFAPGADVGSFRIHTLPNFWIHASGDHAVSSRLTPTGPGTTQAKVDWLVHKDAVEGRDYQLDKLLPFWSVTSDQDWHLCEINQQGVRSSAYRPGVLSERKEAGLDRFLGWYIRTMQQGVEQAITKCK